MMSWHSKQISLLQLDTQKTALEHAWLQADVNLRPESSAQAFQFRDNLRDMLRALKKARKEIEDLPSAPKRLWSDWIVALYLWATKERLKV